MPTPPADRPPLLEAVPNVSEGRRPEVVDRLAQAAAGVPGAELLHCSSDPDHHRSVLTLVGEAAPLERALLALYAVALEAIDLRRHQGVHPRLGAVDVVPFVPLAGASMADAVSAARSLGAEVARRHQLPVFLYERAAAAPSRRNLAEVRRGGFEGLAEKLRDPAWAPDFGPHRPHPSAGATVVGARDFLIAFNVVLDSQELAVARKVARSVREASGGLPAVKALGVRLARRGLVQVSMNLVDFRQTSPAQAFEAVRERAARLGVGVVESEGVGLVPEAAMVGVVPEAIGLVGFGEERILETHLERSGLGR